MAHHFRLARARQADRLPLRRRPPSRASATCTSGRSTPVTPSRPSSKISGSSWSRPRSPEMVASSWPLRPRARRSAALIVHAHDSTSCKRARRRRRSPHRCWFRSPRRSADRARSASCGIRREAGTPAIMPFAASASTTAPAGFGQPDREFVEEGRRDQLDARDGAPACRPARSALA